MLAPRPPPAPPHPPLPDGPPAPTSDRPMDTSPLLDLHRLARGRLTPAGELLTYGDVPAEYRAARENAAVFDRTTRGLLGVSGEDAAPFLHRITAAEVRGLAAGEGSRNLLLSPKGKVLFQFEVVRTEEGFELSTEPGAASELMRALDVYLFAEPVELTERGEAHAPIELVGPRAGEIVEALLGVRPVGSADLAVHAHAMGELAGAPVRVTALGVAGSSGFRLDGGPHAAGLWKALVRAEARPAGLVVHDSLRVEAGEARPGVDVDEGIYPQEARLERAFSLDKGCYIGQEVVAKIDTYGGLNKRLVALRPNHDDPVATGTRLVAGERDLGVVTSWAWSFELDGGLCLGYVKRKHQEPGTEFELAGPDGTARGRAAIAPLPVREDAL